MHAQLSNEWKHISMRSLPSYREVPPLHAQMSNERKFISMCSLEVKRELSDIEQQRNLKRQQLDELQAFRCREYEDLSMPVDCSFHGPRSAAAPSAPVLARMKASLPPEIQQ